MSIRTVIEINHDYLHELENPHHWMELVKKLKSGDWKGVPRWTRKVPGVRILAERHHSTTLDLKVE